MSKESVCWMNHFHFVVARTLCERHLERHIIPSKKERGKEITIKFKNIIFNLDWDTRSVLINILIKNTILKWFVIILLLFFFLSSTFKINKDFYSGFCLYCIYYCCCSDFFVGICTPKQVNNVVVGSNRLGMNEDCGMRVNK
jgi:hypothetical protein